MKLKNYWPNWKNTSLKSKIYKKQFKNKKIRFKKWCRNLIIRANKWKV